MSSMPRDFKGIWIPRELWFDNRLSAEEKILVAEIDSLDCGAPNHCFASNEYLSNLLNIKERIIREMLSRLRKLGYIEYVGFDGRKRNIKSNLKNTQAIFSGSAMQETALDNNNFKQHRQYLAGQHHGFPCTLPIEDSIEGENKDENKDINPPISPKGGAVPAAPKISPKQIKSKEVLTQKAPEVSVTETQHEVLLQKLGGDESKVNRCYEILSDWKIGKGIKGGSDFKSISKWVLKALERESSKDDKSNVREKENKELAEKISKHFKNNPYIEVGYNYIEFKRGNSASEVVRFTDHGFREIVLNYLGNKMGLNIDGL